MNNWGSPLFLVVFLISFLSLIGYAVYLTSECRVAAINQGMSAIEIQAVCK